MSPLLMGMFVLIMFSARISGSHYNPIITFSYMIGNVRQGKFDRILGLFYILSQFLGAIVGALYCTIIFAEIGIDHHAALIVHGDYYIQTIISEIIGSFLMVFMYLCSTEEKTKFTKDSVVQTMILASSYLAAMMLAGSNVTDIRLSPVNPATALGMKFFYNLGNKNDWGSIPIFVGGGFGGSFAAFLFFTCIYKKTADAIKEIEEEEAE
jgi:glycerol uptake facilitator-like aquaporin